MERRRAEAGPGAVFRVDAGADIGIGHLRRCLTLADELRHRGFAVCFICKNRLAPELLSQMEHFPVHWLDSANLGARRSDKLDEEMQDANATLRILENLRMPSSWVVIDHYGLGHRWEKTIRDAGHSILAIDDYRTRTHHADLLVSDSMQPFDPARNELGARSRTLAGWQYALVSPAFAYREDVGASPTDRMLVSYGGSDPTGETVKAIEMLRLLKADATLSGRILTADVVIGAAHENADLVTNRAAGIDGVTVHRALPSLEPLMRQAALVLTAGGNSMVEALALRKPCIVTVTADNQDLIVGELERQGLIRSVGPHAGVTEKNLLQAVAAITGELKAFAARVAEKPVFDHLGSRRIADAMVAMPRR